MDLDIQTLSWILNLSYATNIIFSIVLYRLSGYFPGARLWILAQAMTATASLVLFERAHLPYGVLVLGNAALVAAEALYAHAALAYRQTAKFPAGLYLTVPLVALALLVLRDSSVNLRNVMVNIPIGSFCVWTAIILVRGIGGRYRYAAIMTAFPFALIALGDLTQIIISIGTAPTQRFDVLVERQAILYLLSITTASMSLFGFFLLATQRRQFILERQEAKLKAANERLTEADRIKDLFVSMLAHDLHGPIAGAARYARKHLMPDEIDLRMKRQALGILAASLEKATALLDNVLLWSQNRREHRPVEKESLDLADETRTLISLFLPSFEEKGLEIRVRLEELRLLAERESVELVLRNMLSNAVKFSPPGGAIDVEAGRDNEGRAFVLVADRGSGIPEELRGHLFRIDERVTTAGTAGEPGTGMGLILCAEYAQRMGASFSVEERPGGGTVARLLFSAKTEKPDAGPGDRALRTGAGESR